MAAINNAKLTFAEAHDVIAAFVLRQTDEFVDKCFANKDVLAAPFDNPARPHPAYIVLSIVPWIIKAFGQLYARRPPELGRWLLIERLVGTFLVEVKTPAIDPLLLFSGRL